MVKLNVELKYSVGKRGASFIRGKRRNKNVFLSRKKKAGKCLWLSGEEKNVIAGYRQRQERKKMEAAFFVPGYWALFVVSFGAATILPFGSEPFFTAMVAGGYDLGWCLAAATAGNWLGGMSTYGLGRLGKTDWLVRYFKVSPERLEKIRSAIRGKGAWPAFFCFLPVAGDVIAFVSGLFRADVFWVGLFMLAGKFIRYLLIVQTVLMTKSLLAG